MTDRGPKDPELELGLLGEPEASHEERAQARLLAGRLEGGPQAAVQAGSEEELAALAELSRAIGGGAGALGTGPAARQARQRAEAATNRAMEEIFGAGAASNGEPMAGEGPGSSSSPAEEVILAAADELEARRARRLADAVDRLVAGAWPAEGGALGAEEAALLETAGILRASTHDCGISGARVDALVDEAIGTAPSRRRSRAGRALLGAGLAGALAASVAGLVMLFGQEEAPRAPEVPAHLASRSTRDVLPGAFPRSQTETERIDLIYHDRLRAYRDLELGALASAPDAPREQHGAPTAALAGYLGGGIP